MKIIKLNAWERVFKEKIQLSRERELKHLDIDSIYWTLMSLSIEYFSAAAADSSLVANFLLYLPFYWHFSAFLTHVSSVIIAFVTIAVFLCIDDANEQTQKFTTGRLFAALALFNQLTVPLFIFPITIPIIIAAVVSTRRLEDFLRQPEVQKEFEGIRNMARVMSRSDASLDAFEIDECETHVGLSSDETQITDTPIPSPMPSPMYNPSEINFPIETTNGDSGTTSIAVSTNDFFFRDESALPQANQLDQRQLQNARNVSIKLKKNNQISMKVKQERNRPRQKSVPKELQIEIPSDLAMSIHQAEFMWQTSEPMTRPILVVDKLNIPKGELGFPVYLTHSHSKIIRTIARFNSTHFNFRNKIKLNPTTMKTFLS